MLSWLLMIDVLNIPVANLPSATSGQDGSNGQASGFDAVLNGLIATSGPSVPAAQGPVGVPNGLAEALRIRETVEPLAPLSDSEVPPPLLALRPNSAFDGSTQRQRSADMATAEPDLDPRKIVETLLNASDSAVDGRQIRAPVPPPTDDKNSHQLDRSDALRLNRAALVEDSSALPAIENETADGADKAAPDQNGNLADALSQTDHGVRSGEVDVVALANFETISRATTETVANAQPNDTEAETLSLGLGQPPRADVLVDPRMVQVQNASMGEQRGRVGRQSSREPTDLMASAMPKVQGGDIEDSRIRNAAPETAGKTELAGGTDHRMAMSSEELAGEPAIQDFSLENQKLAAEAKPLNMLESELSATMEFELATTNRTSTVASSFPYGAQSAPPISLQIAKSIDGMRDRFEIQLTPEELGKVEVAMEFDGEGRAHVAIVVERPEALEALARDQRQLERMLAAQGLQLDAGIDLSLKQDQSGQRHAERDAQNGSSFTDRSGQLSEDMEADPNLLAPTIAVNGLFDVVI